MRTEGILTSWSIQKKLLLLLLLTFLPSCGIVIWSGLDHRDRAVRDAERGAMLLVQSLAAQQERVADGAEQMLTTLAQLPEVQKRDVIGCSRLFRELNKRRPLYSVISATAPDGRIFAASTPFEPGRVDLSDRKHFRDAVRTRGFSVGEYAVGKVSNVQTFHFSYPVFSADKELLAVVTASFRINGYSQFISKVNLPKGSAVAVADWAGIRLTRWPEDDLHLVGKPISSDLFERISGDADQGTFERNGTDGVARIFAFRQLRLREHEPPYLFMLVSMPKAEVLHAANVDLIKNLSILEGAAVAILCLAWIFCNLALLRPINHLISITLRFAGGEMKVRTGMAHSRDELGRLAESFDSMASLLEVRDKERRRAETALKESEEKYRELVQQANSIILRMDGFGNLTFANEFAQHFFGYSEEELLGRNVVGVIVPPTESSTGRDLRAFIEGIGQNPEKYANHINENMRRNGERVWIAWTNKPVFDADGRLRELLCVGNDITERKQAEEALERANILLHTQQESSIDGILAVDEYDSIISSNKRFEEMWGIPHELIEAKDDRPALLSILDKVKDPEAFLQRVDSLYAHRNEISLEEIALKDGRTFERYSAPLNGTDGKYYGRTWHFRDLTERRKLEEQLQRAEKMEALGTLAGGVAHDLNNVLGVVVGYSELLLHDLNNPAAAGSEAGEILKGGKRAAAIVQDLLTLARRGVSSRQVLNLNDIVLECRSFPEFTRMLSEHPDITIVTDLASNLPNLAGSPVHLEKSFINLVSNAAEAMPNGGTLTVRTSSLYLGEPISGYDEVREGDYVVLSVSDTGEGIAAYDLKHIFEPFYTKKAMGRSGTGLGLAVVWGTVKDHRGYINVESEEGKGTVFTLYFPVTRERMCGKPVLTSRAEYAGQGESILVVDDVREQRELACTMLRRLGYSVSSVSSGEEVLKVLGKQRVDLLVLDMIMDHGMDGLDTYRKVLAVYPRQKAIIVSGFSETERVAAAQALGAGAYVRKPYVLEKLGLAVRKELDRPA